MLLYEKKEENLYAFNWDGGDFIPHLHHHYEILVCTAGTLIATCCGKTETLWPGDMMIAFSNDIHSYTKTDHGKGVMLILKPGILPLISEKLDRRRYDNFLLEENPRYAELAAAIMEEYQQDQDWIVLYGYLNLLLGLVLKRLPHRTETRTVNSDLFSEVLYYVAEHYTECISLKSLSSQFGVDPCYLSRMFSTHFPDGFLRYLHELRVEHAKYLLQHTNMRISDILYQSGFMDQKTFNRVFLQLTGKTPSQFRNEI